MNLSAVPASGLQFHVPVQPSRCAARLERFIAAAALGSLGLCAWWALGQGALALAGALSCVAAAVYLLVRQTPAARRAVDGLSVDAGGNWAVEQDGRWQRFVPQRAWVSPLGWISLQGAARPLQGPGVPVPMAFTVWFDSVPNGAWRRLRVALQWTMQREGLQVPMSARDPRLERP